MHQSAAFPHWPEKRERQKWVGSKSLVVDKTLLERSNKVVVSSNIQGILGNAWLHFDSQAIKNTIPIRQTRKKWKHESAVMTWLIATACILFCVLACAWLFLCACIPLVLLTYIKQSIDLFLTWSAMATNGVYVVECVHEEALLFIQLSPSYTLPPSTINQSKTNHKLNTNLYTNSPLPFLFTKFN